MIGLKIDRGMFPNEAQKCYWFKETLSAHLPNLTTVPTESRPGKNFYIFYHIPYSGRLKHGSSALPIGRTILRKWQIRNPNRTHDSINPMIGRKRKKPSSWLETEKSRPHGLHLRIYKPTPRFPTAWSTITNPKKVTQWEYLQAVIL